MRIGIITCALIACLLIVCISHAESKNALSAPSTGVALVDFNRAINEVSDGKRAKQRLKDEFRERQQELDRMQNELKTARDSLDRDRLLLSQEVLEEREGQYRRKFSELQQKLDNSKREMAAKETELTHDILSRLRSIVKEIGKGESYTLILEKSQDVVLFAPEGSDITDRVISLYDGASGKTKKK